MLPFGKAKIVKDGTDVTVVTYGATVQRALTAAKQVAESRGLSVEVIDPRTISPLDTGAILASVRKTGRLVAVDSIDFLPHNVVSVDAMKEMFEQLGTPASLKKSEAFPNSGNHVITSNLLGKLTDAPIASSEAFLRNVVKLN